MKFTCWVQAHALFVILFSDKRPTSSQNISWNPTGVQQRDDKEAPMSLGEAIKAREVRNISDFDRFQLFWLLQSSFPDRLCRNLWAVPRLSRMTRRSLPRHSLERTNQYTLVGSLLLPHFKALFRHVSKSTHSGVTTEQPTAKRKKTISNWFEFNLQIYCRWRLC